MTDDELIAFYENNASLHNGLGLDRLIELARIGASVMPRPIEEADTEREEQEYYTVVPSQGVHSITWYQGAKKWKTHALSKHEVRHFYDLSALTKPQVTT